MISAVTAIWTYLTWPLLLVIASLLGMCIFPYSYTPPKDLLESRAKIIHLPATYKVLHSRYDSGRDFSWWCEIQVTPAEVVGIRASLPPHYHHTNATSFPGASSIPSWFQPALRKTAEMYKGGSWDYVVLSESDGRVYFFFGSS